MMKWNYVLLAAILLTGCDKKIVAPSAKQDDTTPQAPIIVAAVTTAPVVETFEESDPVKLTPAAVQRFGIRLDKASVQSLATSFTAPARISLNMEAIAHVGVPVSGRVVEAKVRAGDSVDKDAPLLVIDSPELGEAQSDLLQKRTAVTVAASTIDISQSSYDRAKKLLDESQGIALTEVQKRQADLKAAEGALLSAKAAVMAAENRLKLLGQSDEAIRNIDKVGLDAHFVIRSPIAGRIIERSVALGELVRPERDSLLVVADMRTLWVLADVPEAHIKDVSQGAKVRITLPAVEGKLLEGTVSYISPKLDESTRTVSVRIEIPSDGISVIPGMFAQAEIMVPPKGPAVLSIPESALQMIDGKANVFVPVKGVDNAFVARRIKVGPPVGQMIPVLGGLKEGEPFVATGSFILKADLGKGGVQEE